MAKKTQTTRKTQTTKTTNNPEGELFALLGEHAAARRAVCTAAVRIDRCRDAGDLAGMRHHGATSDAFVRKLVELESRIAAAKAFTSAGYNAKSKIIERIDPDDPEFPIYLFLLGADAQRVGIAELPRFLTKRLTAEALRTYTEHVASAA